MLIFYLVTTILDKIVGGGGEGEIHSLEMLYFLNLKGYEMHLFGVSKIKAFCKPVFLPFPHLSIMVVVR